MNELIYNKLVRDNIISIIEADGKKATFRILDPQEMEFCLRDKLREEFVEFQESGSIEELVDMLEVIEALAENRGISQEEISEIKANKAKKKGKFSRRIFLEMVSED